jgi:hypothetical protein
MVSATFSNAVGIDGIPGWSTEKGADAYACERSWRRRRPINLKKGNAHVYHTVIGALGFLSTLTMAARGARRYSASSRWELRGPPSTSGYSRRQSPGLRSAHLSAR